jgi:histidyl-tRNA synthetase
MRAAGINAEIYPDATKMKKQMGYADKKGISFVALCGENERNADTVTLKNMSTGEQQTVTIDEAVALIKG